ncbi:DUF6153 family protein [Nocardia sp. NPDC046763]|uniref:DUF6153 family protein n=1 Tax=Nocardia sp. NPDC046763 TaxID=3155256 RepID=UPI0033C69BC0
MADPRVAPRVTGYVRLLGVLALLLGIAAMHAGVFSAHGSTLGSEMSSSMVAMPSAPQSGHDTGTHGDKPGGHGLGHACEFLVLSAVTVAIGLVLPHWAGDRPRDARPPNFPTLRIHRARPPPWTVPTLAELSILRI